MQYEPVQFSSVPNGSGQVPSKYKYVTELGDVFQRNTQRLLRMPPQAPEPALRLRQLGCPGARKAGEVESKACGCSYLEVSSSILCFRQSIREGCQTLHRLERLYAKMPRVELSKKQLRIGPNKIGFACAKTTNYQMKC